MVLWAAPGTLPDPEKLENQKKQANKFRVEYRNKSWYTMTGAFYTKEIRRTTFVPGVMKVAGSKTSAQLFFMPVTSTFEAVDEAEYTKQAGEPFYLYGGDSDDEEEEGEDLPWQERVVAEIKKRSKTGTIHLCEGEEHSEEFKFIK